VREQSRWPIGLGMLMAKSFKGCANCCQPMPTSTTQQ